MKITITDCKKKSKDYNRVGNAVQSKWNLVWESLLYRGCHGRFLLGNDFDLSPEDPEKAA